MSRELAESVDDDSFSARVLERRRPMLVLFTARDCLPCDFLADRLPELASDFRGMIDVACCPTEASPRTARRYGVTRTPTLLFFMGGAVVGSRLGPAPLPVIRRWVTDILKRELERGATRDKPTSRQHVRMPAAKAFVRALVNRATVLRACAVASVVAPVLLVLNHAHILFDRPLSYTLLLRNLALNFVVPYLVSSYSSARAASRGVVDDPGARG